MGWGRLGAVCCAMLMAQGCASRPPGPAGRPDAVSAAVEQPMRDLSLIRDQLPAPLQRAAVAPYDPVGVADCAGLVAELAALDAALGADVDAPPGKGSGGQGLAAELIRGVAGLPFRGVVRQVTGASRRDAAYRAGVLAGMVRRGFVKGRTSALGCAPPAP